MLLSCSSCNVPSSKNTYAPLHILRLCFPFWAIYRPFPLQCPSFLKTRFSKLQEGSESEWRDCHNGRVSLWLAAQCNQATVFLNHQGHLTFPLPKRPSTTRIWSESRFLWLSFLFGVIERLWKEDNSTKTEDLNHKDGSSKFSCVCDDFDNFFNTVALIKKRLLSSFWIQAKQPLLCVSTYLLLCLV